MKFRINVFILFLLGLSKIATAQIGGGIEANYVLGFGNDNISLDNQTYQTNAANGYALRGFGLYHFNAMKTDVIFKIGFKQLFISGKNAELDFKGDTKKVVIAVGGRYYFNEKLSSALFLEMENNLDADFLRTQTNDLFRYQMVLQLDYNFTKNVSAFLQYSGAFYPIYDHYIIYNPQHQIGVGVAFKFQKS